MIRVWDGAVRALHWALVAGVGLGWATTSAWLGAWHQPVGYATLGVVGVRIVWGLTGSRFARFGQFVRGVGATWRYARLAAVGREPRFVGHNPLGAWMVLAFFASVALLALTGWLYTTDAFWGDETVERVHRGLAWTIVVLALIHVAGVVLVSLRHGENLVAAMLHGKKRDAAADDIV